MPAPSDLTDAERVLYDAFPRGTAVDLRDATDRAVRATVIRSLLLGAHEAEAGQLPALRLIGARITGRLHLAYAEVLCSVRFEHCEFELPMDFYGVRMRRLTLTDSAFPGFLASTAAIDGNLQITRCRSAGQIRLIGARINGTLILNGSQLTSSDIALQATRLAVGNDILARKGFSCTGRLDLNNADVGGSIRLEGAQLSHPGETALSALDLRVGAIVNCCDGFRSDGAVPTGTAPFAFMRSRRIDKLICL